MECVFCEEIIEPWQDECPNCGTPASESEAFIEEEFDQPGELDPSESMVDDPGEMSSTTLIISAGLAGGAILVAGLWYGVCGALAGMLLALAAIGLYRDHRYVQRVRGQLTDEP